MALRIFCSELTKEINILEHKKYDETVDAMHILSLERHISQRYLFLARFLNGQRELEQECILTAFSMNPTIECYELVCKLAESNQKTADEMASQADTSQNESIDALHTITSVDLMLNSKDYDALRAPNRLLDSLTGLSEGVRSDLVCLLTMPRIKNLNWLVPWPDLKKECQALLNIEKKKQIVENTTASANDKLQFIDLNYEDFKDFKPHEYPGIEKGYEIYVADSDSSESYVNGNGTGNGNGNGNESEDTDTAPESKQFIVKEAKRLRERKRRLIRRSQKLMEEIEFDAKIKKENDGTDQKKKKRKTPRLNSDCLKPRTIRKNVKKTKSGEENHDSGAAVSVKIEPNLDIKIETDVEVKIEPDIDIKIEPDAETMQFGDQDVSSTFADLSNIQDSNVAHFSMTNNFYPDLSNPCNLSDNVGEPDFQRNTDSNAEQLADLANFGSYLSPPIDTSNQSTTIDNPELVSSLNFDHSKNEIDAQTFHSIYDGSFDDENRLGLQLPNLVGILGISYLANETINMHTELDTDEPPVLTELCPLKQTFNETNSCTPGGQMSSSGGGGGELCDVPFATDNSIPATNVQNTKPKNPLIAFRRPKKCANKPNGSAMPDTSNGLSIDAMTAISSPVKSPPKTHFNFENSSNDWITTMPMQMPSNPQNDEPHHFDVPLQRQHNDHFSFKITTDLSPDNQVHFQMLELFLA